MPNKLTVLLVDDHALVRRGFAAFLKMNRRCRLSAKPVTAWKPCSLRKSCIPR